MKKGKSKTGPPHDDGSSDEDLDNYSSHEDAETDESDYSEFSFIDTETVAASPSESGNTSTPKKTPAKAAPKRSPAVRKPATTTKIKTPKSGKSGPEKKKSLPKPGDPEKCPKNEDSHDPTVRVVTVRELRDDQGLPVYKRPGGTFTISSDDLNTDKKVPLMAPNLKRIPTALSNCVHGRVDSKRKSKGSKNPKSNQWARLCIPIGGDEDDINADPLKPKQEVQMVLDAVFEASPLGAGYVVQKRKKMVTTPKAAKKLYQICKMHRNTQWDELKALNIPYKSKDDCPFNVAGNTTNLFLLSDGALAELKLQIGDESAEPNLDVRPKAAPTTTVTEDESSAADTLRDGAASSVDRKCGRKRSRASIVQDSQPESESPNKKKRFYNVQVTISSEMTEEEALEIVRKMNTTN